MLDFFLKLYYNLFGLKYFGEYFYMEKDIFHPTFRSVYLHYDFRTILEVTEYWKKKFLSEWPDSYVLNSTLVLVSSVSSLKAAEG